MKVIGNPSYWNSRFFYSFLVITMGLPAVILYWTFTSYGESNIVVVIPPFIFLGLFIILFALLQGLIPYRIGMKKDLLIITSKLQNKKLSINEIKGYDVDIFNNIRLIIVDSKRKTKILPIAYIDRKTQREIPNHYGLKRYKFKFNQPWGIEEEEEDSDVNKKGKISITATTFSFLFTITLAPIIAILIFIFLKNDINLIFIPIIFGVFMISVMPVFMLAYNKGWIKREPIKERK